jgi:hypothetical protein
MADKRKRLAFPDEPSQRTEKDLYMQVHEKDKFIVACKSGRLFFATRHVVWPSCPLPCSHGSSYADDLRKANAASMASAVARPIEGIQWE